MFVLFSIHAAACEHVLGCEAACEAGQPEACVRFERFLVSRSTGESGPERLQTSLLDELLACRATGDCAGAGVGLTDPDGLDTWVDLRGCLAGIEPACERFDRVDGAWEKLCDASQLWACARSSDPERRERAIAQLRASPVDPTLADRIAPWLLKGSGRQQALSYLDVRAEACREGDLGACRTLATLPAWTEHRARFDAWSYADLHLLQACHGSCPDAARWGWERAATGDSERALVFLAALCGDGEKLACMPDPREKACVEGKSAKACWATARAALGAPGSTSLDYSGLTKLGCDRGSPEACLLSKRVNPQCSSVASCVQACEQGDLGACDEAGRFDGLRHRFSLLAWTCRAGVEEACGHLIGLSERWPRPVQEFVCDERCEGTRCETPESARKLYDACTEQAARSGPPHF